MSEPDGQDGEPTTEHAATEQAAPTATATVASPAAPARDGLGTAALTIGIVAAVLGLVPGIGVLGVIVGAVAIVLGVLGYRRARDGRATNQTAAVVGAVLGLVAFVLGLEGVAFLLLHAGHGFGGHHGQWHGWPRHG